jgi:hypothetical protein
MLKVPPFTFRGRRRARRAQASTPALVLESAEFSYIGPGAALTLTFDRAIELSSFDPSQITVQDPAGTGWAYAGSGVVDTPDPQTVVVEMGQTTEAAGSPDVMSATGATGIVAADDGAAWAGVTNLELPYA